MQIRIESSRFLRACSAGLAEKTALVDLSVHGDVVADSAVDGWIRVHLAGLCPGEVLYGVAQSDWPEGFLVADGDAVTDPALRWLGRWFVALTVAVQRWGRDPVWRGRVLVAEPGRLRLALPWRRRHVFDRALELACELIPRTAEGTTSHAAVQRCFGTGWTDIQSGGLGPNTARFVEAAVRRGMPFDVLPSYVQIGWGANALRLDQAATGQTSWMAMAMAKDKLKASRTLVAQGIPVPSAWLVDSAEQAELAADDLGWPVVVKPLDQDGGLGVVPGIGDSGRLRRAFDQANRLSPGRVLVERHCPGDDHRLLVVRGRVLQVARRSVAQVVGDGERTVRALVDRFNSDSRRGTGRHSMLKTVAFDEALLELLAEQGLGADAVPPEGRIVRLSRTPNVSFGGSAEDVTAVTHPDNIALAERAARIAGLDIAGLDFLCPDITRSWHEVGGVICEVNGQPGFRPHWLADPARDINGEVLDMVLDGRPARVPTAAIAGTNGKTTTAEMLYRIWTAAGRLAGVCTTARLRIGGQTVSTDNLSGQPGARIILNDPAVEAAVLEMPRKGLIYFGHHCDRYTVAALLNVQDDHIGVDGVDTIERMAEVKAEVLERATEAIVVNAEDPLCLAVRARAGTRRHILVARTPRVDALIEHRRQGGEAAFIDDRGGRPWIILAVGDDEDALMPVHDVPATMHGVLAFNEINAVFAAALAWAHGIETGAIRRALGSFANSREDNPGRYNFIEGLPFDVLVDFAHNPDGVRGICAAAAALPVAGRRVLCSLNVGSRHPGHVAVVAGALASSFDDFVLSCDPALVGACPEYAGDDPAGTMVLRARALLLEQGVDPGRISVEVDRAMAVRAALDRARPGDLVVLLADDEEAHRVVDHWRAGRDREPHVIRNG